MKPSLPTKDLSCRSSGQSSRVSSQLAAHHLPQLGEVPPRQLGVLVAGEPEAEPELGVVLEEGVRPGRAAPVGVGRPRRGGQVPTVDRRTAGGVGDRQPVTEQLREELMHGVSPQPAQAPENSKSGSRNCVPRTVPKSTRDRSARGCVSKKAMFCRSAATSGSRSARLMALRVGSPAASAGQMWRAQEDLNPRARIRSPLLTPSLRAKTWPGEASYVLSGPSYYVKCYVRSGQL
jgi:hypothetical protein